MRPNRTRWLIGGGIAVTLLLAFGLSRVASSAPDGLERVAEDHGIDRDERPHAAAGSPLAEYSTAGVDDEGLSTGVAGGIGVAVTFVAATGVVALGSSVRRRRRRPGPAQP